MALSLRLHTIIEHVNPLNKWTQRATSFLLQHPMLYKTALLVNHFFRAAAMTVFMNALPYSLPISFGLCFGASLFYRLTVENNCAYKFALPAFAGAVTFPLAQPALVQLASGKALNNLALFRNAILLAPIAAYLVYIVLTVDYDVDLRTRN